ncbi:MAG: ABC transporter substrate-binding protein [Chloroflexi bacterium]|nr:ABC transporter substrate-binding protein [Chloroflexota bacterium]
MIIGLLIAACSSDEGGTATQAPQSTTVATQVQSTQVVQATPTSAMMEGEAKHGGTLRVVSQASIESLDMSFTGAWVTTVVAAHIWDRLFEPASDYSVHPQMVESWEVNADGSKWTFTLRNGLKFHDGTNVEAADVIPSLKRIWVTQAHGQLLDEHLIEGGAVVVDTKTLVLSLTAPSVSSRKGWRLPGRSAISIPRKSWKSSRLSKSMVKQTPSAPGRTSSRTGNGATG